MTKIENSKQYDLEDRTLSFAKQVRFFVSKLPKTIPNTEDAKQLVRASGSIGANYIEANEALSKKDFLMRVKISRKESKECRFWLNLINTEDEALNGEIEKLLKEAKELTLILSTILKNSE